MKFNKRHKDISLAASPVPPPAASSDAAGPRVPLPPVSENSPLQTAQKAYSRPASVQNMSQFVYPSLQHSNSYQTPFISSSTLSSAPLPTSTNIDMERIMKQDEAAMNDFVPPRQAMNSDESDFDWDEDINIDEKGQVKKKNKNNGTGWRRLSPFLRMVIMVLTIGPTLALPAILVQVLYHPADGWPSDQKAMIVMIFVWIAFMWCIICLTNWGVDIVPVVIVRLTSMVSGARMEAIRSRLLIFVATKKFLKWLLASCWSIGSFAFLSKVIYPAADSGLNPVFIEVLGAIVAGCALLLFEKVCLHIISTNFHRTAYADRITDNKYALMVLDRLSTSKKNINKKPRPSHSRNDTADNTDYIGAFPAGYRSAQPSRSNSLEMRVNGNTANTTKTVNGDVEVLQDNRSDSPQKLTEAMILSSTPMTTPTEHASSRNSTFGAVRPPHYTRGQRDSKMKVNDNIFKGINRRLHGIALANKNSPSKDIGSTANAKRLAKTLFKNLQSNSDELIVQDFFPYFDTEDDARTAFAIFDKDGNGDISKSEMKEKIFYVYKERKDLHTSLRDLSQAVGKLNIIFLTIVAVIWLLIVLSIFGKDVVKNMLSIGSFLVALSFVFGNSLKVLFENIVFLFITHPYDSGDLVSIEGNDMYVREVGLNSTTFVTWDGKRMYYPNNLLSTKPIHNVRRSPNMTDKIVLNVDCYTPQSKILELRARMRDYLIKESKEFLPDLEIQIQEMDAKLKISMCIEHKGNWQDSGRRWARRTAVNTKFHVVLSCM
ncbi:MAG: Mechanosensitive ion channel-domain-containing protein [Podila humilis]|nr:MAG: Mechanosensitive ion channel-domain-containing protein [Podila humilis]